MIRLKETDITKQIKDVLMRVGALPIKIAGGPFQRPGISDLLVCLNGKFVAIEIKKNGNKPTPLQMRFLDDVRRAGGIAFTAYSVDDVVDMLNLKPKLYPIFARRR